MAQEIAILASTFPKPGDLQDIRFGVRALMRRPAFTVVAALTLALGIGANTAIFSVLNTVLIRPLGYPNPERLVAVWGVQGTQGQNGIVFPDYLEWRAQNRTFDDIGVFRGSEREPDRRRYAATTHRIVRVRELHAPYRRNRGAGPSVHRRRDGDRDQGAGGRPHA